MSTDTLFREGAYWQKRGLIAAPLRTADWCKHYCMCPTPFLLDSSTLRIYFCTTTDETIGSIGYVDVDARNPQEILARSSAPALTPGPVGTFDDCGVCPSSLLIIDEQVYFYYFGFQRTVKVPYMIFTGLATSPRSQMSFTRHSFAPIFDRTNDSYALRSAPSIVKEGDTYRAWYNASTCWETLEGGKLVPNYVIRCAESKDGINWIDVDEPTFLLDGTKEIAHSRPCVFRSADAYHMWFSIRERIGPGRVGYTKIAYAVSSDGRDWVRKTGGLELTPSASGFDSDAICYPAVIQAGEQVYLFYNGSKHGLEGFGFAELRYDAHSS